jgi:Secretion system C-terminal sorting domain
MKKRILTASGLLLLSALGSAQLVLQNEVTASAGEVQSLPNGVEISCTVGESAVLTVGNDKWMCTQGFQQVFLTTTPIFDPPAGFAATLVPNPSSGGIQLVFQQALPETLRFRITDVSGRTATEGTLEQGTASQRFDLTHWPGGAYFLTLFSEKNIQTNAYKILKY